MAHKRINYPSVKLRGVYPESSAGVDQRDSNTAYNELGLNTNDLYNQSLGNWTEKVASSRACVANLDLMDDVFASGQVSEDERGRPIKVRFNLMDYFRCHNAVAAFGSPSDGAKAPCRKAYVSMFAEITTDGEIVELLRETDPSSPLFGDPFFVNGSETALNPYISLEPTRQLANEAGLPGRGSIADNGNLMPNYFYAPHDLIFVGQFEISGKSS